MGTSTTDDRAVPPADLKAERTRDRVALAAIFAIPLIWGIGFPLTHNAVEVVDPGLYAFARSLVATVALLPFALPVALRASRKAVLGGLVLGLFSALNIVSQSYALHYLSSASTAFCVTMCIVFIPFVSAALGQGWPSKVDLASVVVGVIGAFIVLGPDLDDISVGYLWGGLAAFAIAMTISIIGKLTSEPESGQVDRLALGFFQVLFGTLALLYFPFKRDLAPLTETRVWIAVVFMGVLSTALAIYLQTRYQRRVGSARTSVIFNLDLVFASLFGLVNRESLSLSQIFGGAVIFLASMLESLRDMWIKAKEKGRTKEKEQATADGRIPAQSASDQAP
ncbi:DMT family transporter [Streptomyces sp. NPDC014870]|uniref:DMT family transporter n=1 Tax=Streptomyces sp. NPDC014870 TaxID=3364925 RepID=UPI0037036910